ncbi:DNA sulfur modification protein DndB [Desulfovibrio inopinatus]|uniref:DNA sulfur modification protein DndB n=1 Tax=Desulfovibrio inopinatus TaxID=102109 RepID=UPI00040EE891|nr:DNA sulfur modification protein DndB [Desulfovibrio inopinatus]
MLINQPTELYERRFFAVRGVQAGREYYLVNCPFYLLPEIFNDLDNTGIPPSQRAQRVINKTRVKAIEKYLLSNLNGYVFSAATVSIDGDINFESTDGTSNVGLLIVKDRAQYIINDGQHRISAIIDSLKEHRGHEYELLPIIFFNDPGLEMSQQIFTDLNRYTLKPAQSLNILYDTRDDFAKIARTVASDVSFFHDVIEFEKTTISNRSIKLFTLNGIYNATKILLGKRNDSTKKNSSYACDFWEKLGNELNEWQEHFRGKLASSILRQNYLSGHNIFLNSAATIASAAGEAGIGTEEIISIVANEDWRRDNPLWEGRALQNGKITKSNMSLMLTTNILKLRSNISLNERESNAEQLYQQKQRLLK